MGNSNGKPKSPTCDNCGTCDNGVCEVKEGPEVVNLDEVKEEVNPGHQEEVLPPKLKDLSSENWHNLAPSAGLAALASASIVSVASVVVSEEVEEEVEEEEEEEPGCLDKMLAEVDEFLEREDPSEAEEGGEEEVKSEEGNGVQQPVEGGIVDDEVQEEAPEATLGPVDSVVSNVSETITATIVEQDDSAALIMNPDTETVLRVTLHSVHDISRTMDLASDVDPYVELSANNVVLGKTHVEANAVTADFEESFFIKTSQDPKSIKLRFTLKDQDVMSEDDFVGFGYFDLSEEYNTVNQKVHLKWKGEEVAYLLITVDNKQVTVVA